MTVKNYLFTSESVSEGHPDKVCDQISDAILDAYLAGDPHSRVACETLVTTDHVTVAGEITSKTQVNVEEIVRETIRKIGYTSDDIMIALDSASTEFFKDGKYHLDGEGRVLRDEVALLGRGAGRDRLMLELRLERAPTQPQQ